jgi:hypothetical protein
LRPFTRPQPPRGVTVFDGDNAQEYPTADEWWIDDKGALHIVTPDNRSVATYVVTTWLRVVAGVKPPPPTSLL